MHQLNPEGVGSTAAPRGHQRRPLGYLLGPAFVAAIAYVDPGNVAANVSAGAQYGYLLVWVLVLANAMAILVQYLSAKLGLVTGRSLPEVLGDRLPRRRRLLFWGQAEVIAAATDLAEIIGGAIALHILFGLPLPLGGLIVGVISMLLLLVQDRRGQRPFEFIISGLLLIITVGFVSGLFVGPISWSDAAIGLVPRFEGTPTVLLAASMLGATVMPHAIYLHSSLARDRFGQPTSPRSTARLLTGTRLDVGLALAVAGSVNIAMLLLAAGNLFGVEGTDSIEGAHAAISATLGPGIGVVFAIGLLTSGLASTSVGAYAGASIMSGLLRVKFPLVARRAVTLIPAIVLLSVGVDPTWALVISQVFLSLGIPFAVIPLIRYTGSTELMGPFRNGPVVRALGWTVAGLIVVLNVALIALTAAGAA